MIKNTLIIVIFIANIVTFAQKTLVLQQGQNAYEGCEDISVADKDTPGYKYMESTYEPNSATLCAAHFTC